MMNETSITQQVLHLGLFLIIAAVVVLAGWNEPLRYLFMPEHEKARQEDEFFGITNSSVGRASLPWRPGGTALDRAPYKRLEDGTIEYSPDHDTKQMGTPTETEKRKNLRGPGR